MSRAYAPYSGFPVGAAALVDDGRIVTGCNVENASYGLGLCAECGLVSALQLTGGGRLTPSPASTAHGEVLVPCGRCRQLLSSRRPGAAAGDPGGHPAAGRDAAPGLRPGPPEVTRAAPRALCAGAALSTPLDARRVAYVRNVHQAGRNAMDVISVIRTKRDRGELSPTSRSTG